MKKKERFSKREILKVKNHIKRVFPQANRIDVKISELPTGEFKSFIRVHTSSRKELIARKKDESFKKSLEKSHLAIIRQIHKVRTKWNRYKNDGMPEFIMSA